MEKVPANPGVAALYLVRERIPEYGSDLAALTERLKVDLMDSSGGSPLGGSGHDFKEEVRQSLVSAGYEVGNG